MYSKPTVYIFSTMERTVTTIIQTERCIGCAECLRVCPSQTISLAGNKAVVSGEQSLACDHCAAVCPVDAVRVGAVDENSYHFKTLAVDNRWLPHGEFDTAALVRLMQSRRSCRNYLARPVARPILEDLINIGITAPSGTNSQKWTFTVLSTRAAVVQLGNRIAEFYRRLNRMARNAWLRRLLKLVGKTELDFYYREYYGSAVDALEKWEKTGFDALFHGAPAAILVGSGPGASCPMEDALLATQNILLGAHSMGLGTCLIGFAVAALKNDRSITRFMSIPKSETIYSVIALGYPDEWYQRVAGRKSVTARYFKGLNG